MLLSEKEKEILHDRDFLVIKSSLMKKISLQMELVRNELLDIINDSNFDFADDIDISTGKIFRGENYRELPYVVLDFPKKFSKHDTFVFRNMFWWGNFFSSTLHIQGHSLSKYSSSIIDNSNLIENNNYYSCVNDNPWEYHFESDNYQLLTTKNKDILNRDNFLKISKQFDLDLHESLPSLAGDFLINCLQLLSNN